jgi:hexosaminidase
MPDNLGDTDESYELHIDNQTAWITANQYSGAMRGLSTFGQIIKWNNANKTYETNFLPIDLTDSPRYSYRGLMLDTSRRFYE